MTLLFLLLHAGCFVESQSVRGACSLELTLEPTVAAPGEQIALRATPQTAPYDTVVFIDDLRLVPDDVEEDVDCDVCLAQSDVAADAFDCAMDCPQDACDQCSTCRTEEYCGPCERCLPCEDICDMCVERAYVTLPETLGEGDVEVLLTNKYGTTNTAQLTILSPIQPGDSGSDSATVSDSATPSDSATSSSGSTATDSGSAVDTGVEDSGLSSETSTVRRAGEVLQSQEEEATSTVRP